MPADGYGSTELAIENGGAGTAQLVLEGFDFERLCLPGFSSTPAEIGEVKSGQRFSLFVGVCGYDAAAGERDLELSGELLFRDAETDEALAVPWTFTPTRSGG